MRRQIEDHVVVGTEPAEIGSHRVDVEQIAQLAGVDQLLNRANRVGEQESVIDGQDSFRPASEIDKLLGLGNSPSQRFLDQNVLPGQHARRTRSK